jgi:hypothetical protein
VIILRLGETKVGTLHDAEVVTYHNIDRGTEKAIHLSVRKVADGMEIGKWDYWLPKSQITYDQDKIEIPEWLWAERRGIPDLFRFRYPDDLIEDLK